MRNTENHYGLVERHDENGQRFISGDNGETWEITPVTRERFNEWVGLIQDWTEESLTQEDIEDLREILQ